MKFKIVTKYILYHYIPIFLLTSFLFLVFFFVGDLIDISRQFTDHNVKFKHLVLYFLNILPFYYIKFILPISNLLAVFISFGLLNKTNELIAMRACGINLFTIIKPVVMFGIIISLIALILNIQTIPQFKKNADFYKDYKIKNRPIPESGMITDMLLSLSEKMSLSCDNFKYNKNKNSVINKLTVTSKDSKNQSRISMRLDADRAEYVNNQWIGYNGIIRTWDELGNENKPDTFIKQPLNFINYSDIEFYSLYNIKNEDKDTITLFEFIKYYKILDKTGFSVGWIKTDIYYIISFPFSTIILILFGLPIALHSSKSNVAFGFGLCLMISFAFWICTYIFIVLGHISLIPPFIAANLTNLIFLLLSLYLNKYLKNKLL